MLKCACKILMVCLVQIVFSICSFSQIENSYYNGRLINLTQSQYKDIATMEKRLYHQTFATKTHLERIEQLEFDLFGSVQNGTPSLRLNNLKIISQNQALRGTSIPPSMMKNYHNKHLQNDKYRYSSDVGLIDGFFRLLFPKLYFQLEDCRILKESNGTDFMYFE